MLAISPKRLLYLIRVCIIIKEEDEFEKLFGFSDPVIICLIKKLMGKERS